MCRVRLVTAFVSIVSLCLYGFLHPIEQVQLLELDQLSQAWLDNLDTAFDMAVLKLLLSLSRAFKAGNSLTTGALLSGKIVEANPPLSKVRDGQDEDGLVGWCCNVADGSAMWLQRWPDFERNAGWNGHPK